MSTKRMIAAVIAFVILFCNTIIAYAKDIPEYYSKYVETGAYELYGFEHYSLAFRLKAGEIYTVPSLLADGTSVNIYYVCDGDHTLRLSTPSGEVITRKEYENWIANKTSPAKPVAPPTTTENPADVAETTHALKNGTCYTVLENELEVIRLVNEERKKVGLNPVTLNANLCNVARTKASEMVDLSYFSHESPTYGRSLAMIEKFGIECKGSGECISYSGGTKPNGVMWDWMHSETHKKIILGAQYKEIGVGLAEDGTGLGYWSLMMIY